MIGRLTALVASAASLLALGAAVTASPALAHPLGNFTTNQLAQVRIDERQARVHYVLDQAEIPTFQQIQRFDAERERDDRGGRAQAAAWTPSWRRSHPAWSWPPTGERWA